MLQSAVTSPGAARPDDQAFRALVDAHLSAVRLHCYQMLGSLQDAEDLAQETLLRAWRGLDRYEGRASLRGWLYRIATNACLDELQRRGRRLLPPMVGSPVGAFVPTPPPATESTWLEPLPEAWYDVADPAPGPEARYELKEAVELAFVAALQRLAPRQRAVLLLRDVLGWSARDTAGLLDMSVAATNSALQRARGRLGDPTTPAAARLDPRTERDLVERYVNAWEQADLAAFVALLKDDAVLSMPPLFEWYTGPEAIGSFFRWATGPSGPGRLRFVPTRANNGPALGIYGGGPSGPALWPTVLSVLQVDRGGIASVTSFMYPRLFPFFDLPSRLDAE